MTVKTESVHTGEFLVSEGNNSISREEVVIAAGQALLPGAVLGKNASDEYAALDPAASDGTEVAAGVLYAAVETAAETGKGVAFVRLAEVVDSLLVWPAGITDEEKATAKDQLASQDIITRN